MDKVLNSNIKNFRVFRGITQDGLAKQLGKSKNVISNWERGDNSPDIESVEKMCKILRVTPNQLFGWDICKEYEDYTHMMKKKQLELISLENEKEKLQQRIDYIIREIKAEEAKRNE